MKRIFLLGPSHHYHLRGCALSSCAVCETPVGNLTVDSAVVAELHKTGKFEKLDPHADEEEHSLEMHMPYLAHVREHGIGEADVELAREWRDGDTTCTNQVWPFLWVSSFLPPPFPRLPRLASCHTRAR